MQTYIEYIVVSNISEQIILLEIPKLFSEIVSNEKNAVNKNEFKFIEERIRN